MQVQPVTIDHVGLLIVTAPAIITALGGFGIVIYKLGGIHKTMNSRLDQLVLASKAQGRQDERDAHSVTVAGVPAKGQDAKANL